ncbi:MAG: carboxymuconolactone decarboxylase family protein [Proteobacteria bacterium]|nr:carboxymuconolactone decarboxylase family protein [Pseudomonadota bacterium]
MSRIPLLPGDLVEPAELIDAIRARRGGTLLHLDRMLLHSPALARAWNDYLGAIRGRLSISSKLRELVICAVARLNGADYEFAQHAPEFRRAGGSAEALAALHDLDAALAGEAPFDALERAALRVTCELTRELRVSEPAFAALRAALPDASQQVELIAVIATYNMVSRFLIGCDVPPEDAEGG